MSEYTIGALIAGFIALVVGVSRVTMRARQIAQHGFEEEDRPATVAKKSRTVGT